MFRKEQDILVIGTIDFKDSKNRSWLIEEAEKGDSHAQFMLGSFYLNLPVIFIIVVFPYNGNCVISRA